MAATRRDFLRMGLGASTLLGCGASVPLFLARSASLLAADPRRTGAERILVVVQLDGGNDGLNTVVPYKDDGYLKARRKLRLAARQLHRIDDHVGLHPSLGGLSRLLQKDQLAIVQSIGYPNPNRSHFESMAIWQTARPKPSADTPGWLARALDTRTATPGGDAPALHISSALLPQALGGGSRHVPSLASLEQFRRRLSVPEGAQAAEQREALDRVAIRRRTEPGSLLSFVEQTSAITYASSSRLEEVMRGQTAAPGYPEFSELAQRLKLIAQLIKANLKTSIFYTELGGFDTHANQLATHANLLFQLGGSLEAFLNDLNKSGHGERVLVLVFSEFGRRLAENASDGTDHGTAAPVFLLGKSVRPGLHGPYPNLHDLSDGDPRFGVDFRQIYATVLDLWLHCPSAQVLGEKLEPMRVLQG
jgi:uncharacterized protein (DUF1501 family)